MIDWLYNLSDPEMVKTASVIGGFATAVGAAFALVAVPIAVWQMHTNRNIVRQNNAKSLYRDYLSLCLNNIELARPNGTFPEDYPKRQRYELFVAQMLFVLEEILMSTDHPDWRLVARSQIAEHKAYLFSSLFMENKSELYNDEIQQIIHDMKQNETPHDLTIAASEGPGPDCNCPAPLPEE